MTRRKIDEARKPRRGQGDGGTAILEFAIVGVLLLTLVFGIITFGGMLSFRQDVTRAAAEGARGGAVAIPLVAGQSFSAAAQTAWSSSP